GDAGRDRCGPAADRRGHGDAKRHDGQRQAQGETGKPGFHARDLQRYWICRPPGPGRPGGDYGGGWERLAKTVPQARAATGRRKRMTTAAVNWGIIGPGRIAANFATGLAED